MGAPGAIPLPLTAFSKRCRLGHGPHFRKRLATLESRLIEHYLKQQAEEAKPQPDEGTLAYWRKEIRGRLNEINYLRRKLGLPERKE
jgi:hypothetical protein